MEGEPGSRAIGVTRCAALAMASLPFAPLVLLFVVACLADTQVDAALLAGYLLVYGLLLWTAPLSLLVASFCAASYLRFRDASYIWIGLPSAIAAGGLAIAWTLL